LKVHVRQDPAETASVPEATAAPKSFAISPQKSASRKFNLTASKIRRHCPRGVGAVDGHVAQPHQSGLLAQPQRFYKQTCQRLQIFLTEDGNRIVVRMLIGS